MAGVVEESELTARVARLDSLLGVSGLVRGDITKSDIADYYRQSAVGYALVHSFDGAIHMALSTTGEFDRQGYGRQVQIIEQRLSSHSPGHILELGCGRGYNLLRLGSRFPSMDFVGIDLTPSHVRSAKRRLRRLPNVRVRQADFESMPFADGTVDAIYSVESFCHAVDLRAALSEAARVVSCGGLLILVDAWQRPPHCELTSDQRRALDVIQKSMAVPQATPIEEWLSIAGRAGWRLIEQADYTTQVMPNLERFERLATALVTRRRLASLASRLAPKHLMNNVIAGYLMAQSVRQKFYFYGLLVLQRA